jgi:hypothetical protein
VRLFLAEVVVARRLDRQLRHPRPAAPAAVES